MTKHLLLSQDVTKAAAGQQKHTEGRTLRKLLHPTVLGSPENHLMWFLYKWHFRSARSCPSPVFESKFCEGFLLISLCWRMRLFFRTSPFMCLLDAEHAWWQNFFRAFWPVIFMSFDNCFLAFRSYSWPSAGSGGWVPKLLSSLWPICRVWGDLRRQYMWGAQGLHKGSAHQRLAAISVDLASSFLVNFRDLSSKSSLLL